MRKETEEWFRIASEDLESADALMEKKLFRMVCYHAQQAVEKILKALTMFFNQDFLAQCFYPC